MAGSAAISRRPDRLFHWTCSHGAEGIERDGLVKPGGGDAERMVRLEGIAVAWFSDLDSPLRAGLGLTSLYGGCDRTQHRFEVDPAELELVTWWPTFRRQVEPEHRSWAHWKEATPGVMPVHWYVSRAEVPVLPGSHIKVFGAVV